MCTSLCMDLCFLFQWAILRSGMARLYGGVINCKPKTVVILHSHHQSKRIPVSPHPHQHLLLSVFFDYSHLNSYLIIVLICISQWLTMFKHLFMGLFAIHSSSIQIVSHFKPKLLHYFSDLTSFKYTKTKGFVSMFFLSTGRIIQ